MHKCNCINTENESAPNSVILVVNFVLQRGGTAVQAVEAAVCVLENDDHFNAGRGSLLNKKSEVECDAMIMEGHTLESGTNTMRLFLFFPACNVSAAVSLADDFTR